MTLADLRSHLDSLLRIAEIQDWPNALNGLQLENAGNQVTRIAAAVDANVTTVDRAVERGADLLLVHHGLFWGGMRPLRGRWFQMWRRAIEAGLAVYSAHLPLDIHPEFGNNALLARALGMSNLEPFLDLKGTTVGFKSRLNITRDQLVQRLEAAVGGRVIACPGGSVNVGMVGVVTGGAGSEARDVAACGVDTFVTGEGQHWTFGLAEELGMNILYGGHYATETFGVKAVAAHLSAKFNVPWEFIDHPSGL
jgi:dinuclear metal center YbgI/SA1388 family protein